MAYQTVEQDDTLEDGRPQLEFKSFLGPDSAAESTTQPDGVSHNPGYFRDQAASSPFWTVEYYQKYFDVDTQTVIERCYTTLLPTSKNYLTAHLTQKEIYGAFWTLTTVILALFISSSLASSISSYLSDAAITFDFGLLSIAVSLVYAYGLGVPILLYFYLRWVNVSWSLIEAITVFGYAQFIWVPISLLCIIPEVYVRWLLVGIGFCMSGWFIVANVYPVLSTAESKATRSLIIVLVVLHAALALTFKILFFSYYLVAPSTKDPLGETSPPPPSQNTTSLLLL